MTRDLFPDVVETDGVRPTATDRPPKRVALPSPLKWHGGKRDQTAEIIALFPRHLHYVEAYAGGLSVLLARDPADPALWLADDPAHLRGVSEVANDLDGTLTNFWRVLQRPDTFDRFHRVLQATPFSRREWTDAAVRLGDPDPVEAAVAFFVHCRQSLAGRRNGFTGITRNRTRGRRNGEVNAWWNAIEGLPAVAGRVRDVLVENRPALDVIRGHDGPHTFFYLDPPYLHETRSTTGEYGGCEMTDGDHAELLDVLAGIEGKFLLSGYRSEVYDRAAGRHGWRLYQHQVNNHAAGGPTKEVKTECLWHNYDPPRRG
jgi:DNA adenine methylase